MGLLLWSLVAIFCGAVSAKPSSILRSHDIPEDATLDLPHLAAKYGYPSETHKVQTDDGYILTLHRIPYGKKCGIDRERKPPVLVQHGLLCSSIDWLILGPEQGLGYVLADHCYDVWLGNSRGNTQSKAHVSLDVHSSKFWDFSWHEMGKYDIPAAITYILHATGKPNLHYVGHSQGTTQFFVFGAEHPEFVGKVRSMHAMAPIGFMKHLKSPVVQILSRFTDLLGSMADLIGMDEFLPQSGFLTEIGQGICGNQRPELQDLCGNVIFLLCGFDSAQLNLTTLPSILGHTPAGAATKQLIHYAQGVTSGKFRQFDYGQRGNHKHYGSDEPPEYNLSQIQIPIALHYSENDWMAAVEDVEQLADMLPHLISKFKVPLHEFNHLDFMWAIDADTLLYEDMINVMDTFAAD